MLIIARHIIQDGTAYEELGGNHYDRLHPDRSARQLIKRLEQIGFSGHGQKANLGIVDVRRRRLVVERNRTQQSPVQRELPGDSRFTIST